MIIGFEGGLGTGKTIGMVRYLKKDEAQGNDLFINFGMKDTYYNKLNVTEIMENENLQNVSIGIDEITVFLDCRKSMSKMNRMLSYFILQTRKRNVNMYYTTQDFGMVDLRLIRHTSIQIFCENVYNDDNDLIPNVKKYSMLDLRDKRNLSFTNFYLDISPYYKYYDTNEIILPPI